jgi:adenylate cyclase
MSRLPFGLYVIVAALITAATVTAGLAAAALPWLFMGGLGDWQVYVVPFLVGIAASIGFTAWFTLDRLLGGGVLVGLLTGRYHHPRREERIFLFADLKRATGIAERLGELRYHAFLNRLFADAARPVEAHGGTIYQYVGDEMVVTWTLERGLRDWACLRCAFAIAEELDGASSSYQHEFGAGPGFRFALHAGPVVAGEIGGLKREIVYSGDTLNTAARIESLAKEAGRELVASEDLLRQAPLPSDITAESLGAHRLRGKERPVELFAVVRG